MKKFSLVVAMDQKNGIGKNGDLAWKLSADLKHFKEITSSSSSAKKQNAVIMGRKTWDSLPERFKPLPARLNVVLSQNPKIVLPAGVLLFLSLDQALQALDSKEDIDKIFVIGGAQIFTQAIGHPGCLNLFVTHLKDDFGCDVFFPAIPASFKKTEESAILVEGPLHFRFCQYQKTG